MKFGELKSAGVATTTRQPDLFEPQPRLPGRRADDECTWPTRVEGPPRPSKPSGHTPIG